MSRWAVRHPVWGLVSWFVLIAVVIGAVGAFGGKLIDSFALPNTPSQQAQDLLQSMGSPGPTDTSISIVWHPSTGLATDPVTEEQIRPLLTSVSLLDGVQCVTSPFGDNLGTDCSTVTNQPLEKVLIDTIVAELSKATNLSAKDLRAIAELIPKLTDLEKISPKELGKLAASLPGLAKIAQAPKSLLDGLASLTEAELLKIPGMTKADARSLVDAFGALSRIADLPRATLAAVAKLDAAKLRAFAEQLPADIGKLEAGWAAFQRALKAIEDAARATQAAISTVSPDGRIAYATVTITGSVSPTPEGATILSLVEDASSPDLLIGAQGAALEGAGQSVPPSDLIGMLVALLILIIAFGSLVAAGLPIVVALFGLIGGELMIYVVAHFMNVASFTPALAGMIGLGVGIDYALFIMNRFRQGVQTGQSPKQAAETAVGTAGRAVLFAGTTVIIALVGMLVLRISFFNGLAIGAAVTVLMVMLSALLLLPSLLSLLGTKALAVRMPWARTLAPFDPQRSRWTGYARLLQRKPVIPLIISLVVIAALAWPALKLSQGFPDDSSQAPGSPLRTGYDLMAEGFGPGISAPFIVAVQTSTPGNFDGLASAITALEQTPGIARTVPNSGMLPLLSVDPAYFGGPNKDIAAVIAYPTTSGVDPATATTLNVLRDTTAPALAQQGQAQIFIGGTQAVSEDFTTVLAGALPLFLLLVVGLGFLALMLLFRSLLIPLTAAITSLLSFAGALGVTVAVFQFGWLDSILGVSGTGPILPFLPIMVFAILFGLSMDYQVFLVSRMREEWERTGDSAEAVRIGLAGSGRVVVSAALIMTSVFLAFVPTPIDAIKLFGVALGAAVLIDAFVVRLVLVPSAMTLFGRANWWIPRWLGRVLPTITLE